MPQHPRQTAGSHGPAKKHTSVWSAFNGVLFLVLFSCMVSCGIPSYPYLYAPPENTIAVPLPTEYDFEFGIPTSNDPKIFFGFELYYKLYTSDQVFALLEDDRDRISGSVGTTDLQSAGYRRVYARSEVDGNTVFPSPPLVPILTADRKNETLRIVVDFSQVSDTTHPRIQYIFDTQGAWAQPGRALEVSAGQYSFKGFAPGNFAAGDPDLPNGYDPTETTTSELYVALYALSYGNDFTSPSGLNLYSAPAYLGYIAIPP